MSFHLTADKPATFLTFLTENQMDIKISPRSLGTTSSLFLAVALSACGGGGDDAPAPAPAPYSQSTARAVVVLGQATAQLMLIQTQLEQVYIGGLLQGLSGAAATGSVNSTPANCATNGVGSGSFTVSQIKAGTYVGYKVNDSFDITYTACRFASSNMTLNGKISVVSLGNYASLGVNTVVNYRVSTTNFELNSSALRFRSNGVQTARYDSTIGAGAVDVTTVAGNGRSVALFSSATALSPALTWSISPGMAVNARLTSANFLLSMNGDISTATSSSEVPLSFGTPTPLTGPYLTNGLYPTGGIMRAKEPRLNLLTETTYQGSVATVRADTNRDGVLDLTFVTTALALGT